MFEVPNISILLWVITSHYFFYGTGHQPAWSNIDWNAAFIGTSGVLSNKLVQGSLIIVNVFCPYIILGFMVPMLVITPFTLFIMMPSVLSRNKDLCKDVLNQGELFLFEKHENMFTSVLVTSCKYLACHGIRVIIFHYFFWIKYLYLWLNSTIRKDCSKNCIFSIYFRFYSCCGKLILLKINQHLIE